MPRNPISCNSQRDPEDKARGGSDAKPGNSDMAEHHEQITGAFFAHGEYIPTVRKFRTVARRQT